MIKDSCAHILVEGKVQGVGFRYFVKRVAEETNLTGWVRNLYDERVEIIAQGKPDQLAIFIAAVREGPTSALVSNLTIEWLDPDPSFLRFSIAPTL